MSPPKTRPVKPKGSPLFPHQNGQWSKKIRGRLHYFGPWCDHARAVENYQRVASDLHAGRQPVVAADSLTLGEVLDAFLDDRVERAARGELRDKTICSYEEILTPVREWLGGVAGGVAGGRAVVDLTPADFTRLMRLSAERWGPTRRGNMVAVIKAAFRWAVAREFLEHEPRYGLDFCKPARRLQRAVRRERGPRLFEAETVRAMLHATETGLSWGGLSGGGGSRVNLLHCWILLAINGGFGQTDISELPRKAIDLGDGKRFNTEITEGHRGRQTGSSGWGNVGGVIDWPRPKTGVERIVPLWPETVAALRQAFAIRDGIEPADPGHDDRVFLTRNGLPLVRPLDNTDVVGMRFNRLRKKFTTKPGLGFYALRHTFETMADDFAGRDPHAAARIMGHALPGMKDVYNERIDLERLRHVTNHVRDWLFSEPEPTLFCGSSSPDGGA